MLVAVYGTLKKNYSNHEPHMRDAQFKYHIVIPGIMFSMLHYPGVILHNQVGINNPDAQKFCMSYKTHCEVYEIDNDILKGLDRLEGHPEYYMRVPYALGNLKEEEVWIYTIKPHVYLRGKQRLVPSGCWEGLNTTIQEVDFGPGNCKPKIMAWSGLQFNMPKPSAPGSGQPRQMEEWDDIDESSSMHSIFDSRDIGTETAFDDSYEIIGIDIDDDIDGVKEAV